jgi:hypothetical protein
MVLSTPHQHVSSLSVAQSSLNTLMSPFLGDLALPVFHCKWKQHYMSHALLSIAAQDEARLRYRALCHPAWTITDLLTDALNRGIPLQLAVPIRDAPAFVVLEHVLRPDYYGDGYQDITLTWPGDAKIFADSWLDACKKILCRPHARGFIFMGGLLWRLAIQIAGQALIQNAADGPSIAATLFGRRGECLDGSAFVDAPSAREIAVLLGEVSLRGDGARFLWPPAEPFRFSNVWRGEWNADCEHWFQTRWDELCSPNGVMPKRQGEWRRLWRYGRRDRKDWQASSNEAVDIFVTTTQRRWNGLRVADILLPETLSQIIP